jgi:hypothetical protein
MTWNIGSGLGALLSRVLHNPSFQESLKSAVEAIGQKVNENINNPENLLKIANNLMHNSDAVAGTVVKDTEAERLVDSHIVAAAANVKTK